jgi:hypothetical protein
MKIKLFFKSPLYFQTNPTGLWPPPLIRGGKDLMTTPSLIREGWGGFVYFIRGKFFFNRGKR